MKIKEAQAETTARLTAAHVEEASLEAELLLRHLLCINAVELILEHDEYLTSHQARLLDELVERRISGEPLAYITGKKEFYGRDFEVNPFVLIPRPETEHLVEKAIELGHGLNSPIIADIGTGSGAIGVTLAAELPVAKIYAIDISYGALDTARLNARKHGVEKQVMFLQGDLTKPLPVPVDILIANLPYVKSADFKNSSCEPRLAFDGGEQGLDIIERLLNGLRGKIKPGGYVLLEIGQGQAKAVTTMLKVALDSEQVETINDLAGIERVVWGRAKD